MSGDGETTERKTEPREITINAGDFTFESEIFGSKTLACDAIPQGIALALMAKHYEFYGQLNKVSATENYVTREAVITCDCGDQDRLLDAYVDHGVIIGNGKPLMTCNDCKINENIYNFGLCSPKVPYNKNLPHPSGSQKKNAQGEMCYRCMPMLGEKWKQGESHLLIGDVEDKEFREALKEGAYLTCSYGGLISVVDLPPILCEIVEEKYITLDLLNKKGWEKIHCGYNVEGNEDDDSMYDDKRNVRIERKHRIINQDDVDELNSLFKKFHITTKEKVCAFMAMCSVETGNGDALVEKAGKEATPTREGLREWFEKEKKYGYVYRGGGVIHLTHYDNYKHFVEWLNDYFEVDDAKIMEYGAEYVAYTYPWIAGIFYWDFFHLNDVVEPMEEEERVVNNAILEYLNGDEDTQIEELDNGTEKHLFADFFAPIDEAAEDIVGSADAEHKVNRRRRYLDWIKDYPEVPIS